MFIFPYDCLHAFTESKSLTFIFLDTLFRSFLRFTVFTHFLLFHNVNTSERFIVLFKLFIRLASGELTVVVRKVPKTNYILRRFNLVTGMFKLREITRMHSCAWGEIKNDESGSTLVRAAR